MARTPPLILLNSSVTQVADLIMDNYAVPVDLLEQFGKAFACRAAEDVADFASKEAEDALGELMPNVDNKVAGKVGTAVYRAVRVAIEDAEWSL